MQKKKAIGVVFLIIFIGFAGFAAYWVTDSSDPMEEALNVIKSDADVSVQADKNIAFTPVNSTPTTGIIFYPGGKVEPEAYSVLAKSIASQGYLVVIVSMPLNLAVLGANRAEDIMTEFSSISNWVMAGHSLGGSMAAKYTFDHPEDVQGLILLASYPTDFNNLSKLEIPCVSLYGEFDTVLSKDIPSTASLLPSNHTIHMIASGNHAYFGYYGEQKGDGVATISRNEQHNETINYILAMLAHL
ncbi:hypothetical protein NEF87_002852 [Candidatus Lokiarchaeum ossiferum]|uniref:Alpha/beta hydrolase fold-5 domain-containing protein n=1 Tax=Candidatus Lokiarchaeum ossiferum TaxID=2951803 RepID=A0ABY6HW29_9ARCH|nr:hypothetical protein NEF87_002852 [Candidatus Lokiarchaeum sp. B-35]